MDSSVERGGSYLSIMPSERGRCLKCGDDVDLRPQVGSGQRAAAIP